MRFVGMKQDQTNNNIKEKKKNIIYMFWQITENNFIAAE